MSYSWTIFWSWTKWRWSLNKLKSVGRWMRLQWKMQHRLLISKYWFRGWLWEFSFSWLFRISTCRSMGFLISSRWDGNRSRQRCSLPCTWNRRVRCTRRIPWKQCLHQWCWGSSGQPSLQHGSCFQFRNCNKQRKLLIHVFITI